MDRKQKIADLRVELERLEAEEKAARPALAAGQVWRNIASGELYLSHLAHDSNDSAQCRLTCWADGLRWSGKPWFGRAGQDAFEYVGLARDVLRLVPPKWEEERNLLLELESLYRGTSRESREMNAVLRKLDAVHNPSVVVPPDPPAPQVAPEPTGAELVVGRQVWYRGGGVTDWVGPAILIALPTLESPFYGVAYKMGGIFSLWSEAKPYVEGVAP